MLSVNCSNARLCRRYKMRSFTLILSVAVEFTCLEMVFYMSKYNYTSLENRVIINRTVARLSLGRY